MPIDQRLLDRAGELKQELIVYAEHRRLRKELDHALRETLGPDGPSNEGEVINAVDHFALEHPLRDGGTVLERFIRDRRDLSDADRALLLAWRDVVEGVFEIERRDGDTIVAHNLLDELTYRINSNMGPEWMTGLRRAMFLQSRIVPLGDEWLLSGSLLYLKEEQRDHAEETAATFAITNPESVFRNPAKLAEGWKRQNRSRDHFIRFFGSDLVVIPGDELEQRMRAWQHEALFELRDEKGETAADRIQQLTGSAPTDDPLLDEYLYEEDTVGVFYDVNELHYLPDYGSVLEAFQNPELAGERWHRAAVKDYIEAPDLPPAAIRRLAEEDESRAEQMIRIALKRPDFSWQRDGGALLRRHKRDYYDEPPLPSIVPLTDRIERARVRVMKRLLEGFREEVGLDQGKSKELAPAALPKAGRNDPCPCGSGKKYKRCHGQ